MKYVDEFRDPRAARALIDRIRGSTTRPRSVMEVCGGQTHTLVRHGIDALLSGHVDLIHGPGCPVCVTPVEKIDRALAIASRGGVTLATFGDMIRVPGSDGDLMRARSRGADVRVVYSPTDAVELASRHPERSVVFFGVGFETTAPANAMAVWLARRRGLVNFSMLVSQVLVPPAIRVILDDRSNRIEGFIAPGHVCAVMGYRQYEELGREYGVPFVVAGFEPLDLLQGLLALVRLVEQGRVETENRYGRTVRRDGNLEARRLMDEVFEVTDMSWRGIGSIPASGLRLRPEYADHDAELRFDLTTLSAPESPDCIAGAVLQGKARPGDCPAFGRACTPDHPLGAPMVSNEGACSAYHAVRRDGSGPTGGADAV